MYGVTDEAYKAVKLIKYELWFCLAIAAFYTFCFCGEIIRLRMKDAAGRPRQDVPVTMGSGEQNEQIDAGSCP